MSVSISVNGVAATSFMPTMPVDPVNPGQTEAPDVMPASKVDELMCSGDVSSIIAAMLIKTGAQCKEAARISREASLQVEEAAMQKKLEHMEREAEKRFIGGFASGAGAAAAGGASLAGACTAKSDLGLASWKASGDSFNGATQGVSAYFNYAAADEAKQGAQADREVTQAKRAVESNSDYEKDAKELLGKVMDHYKELVLAKEDSKKAALFRA